MMRSRDWLVLLGLQILAVALVVLGFKFVDRSLAGLTGGFVFTTLSIYTLYKIVKKRSVKRSFTFWTTVLFLILAVLPMLIYRLMYWGHDFQTVLILGSFTAQEFHKFSEKLYLIMMLSTVLDYIRFQAWENE